jgi:hypothetical protein
MTAHLDDAITVEADRGAGQVHLVARWFPYPYQVFMTPAEARAFAFGVLAASAQLDGQHPHVQAGANVHGQIVRAVHPVDDLVSITHSRRVWREDWQVIP